MSSESELLHKYIVFNKANDISSLRMKEIGNILYIDGWSKTRRITGKLSFNSSLSVCRQSAIKTRL